MTRVLGIDIGFADLGWAVVELGADEEHLVAAGVISTKPSSKKRQVRATDDNVRRARELATALVDVCDRFGPRVLAAESMSWPRSSSACAKLGIAWGVLIATARSQGLAMVQTTPMELKRALTSNGKASKEAVIAAVSRRLPRFPVVVGDLPDSKVTHAADAAAAVLACADAELVIALRGSS